MKKVAFTIWALVLIAGLLLGLAGCGQQATPAPQATAAPTSKGTAAPKADTKEQPAADKG